MKKLLLILLLANPLFATQYYVDKTAVGASDSNNGLAATTGGGNGPWLTIGKCATTIVAGDICQVQTGGTYDARITETTDGLVGSRITYQAQAGSPRPKVRGFTLTGVDYITVDGFELTTSGMSADSAATVAVTGTHTGVWITDNYIHNTTSTCITEGSGSFDIISGNTITLCGAGAFMGNAAAIGGVFGQPATDILIDNNTISYVSDYTNPFGNRWVIRNNTLGPADAANTFHIDGMQNNGVAASGLFEGNVSTGNNSSDNHLFLNQISGSDGWIIRYNSLTNTAKGGLDWRNADLHSFYNNTFYDSIAGGNTNNFQILTTGSTGNISRNNIWYHASSATPYSGVGYDKDYDLYYSNGNPVETHSVNADPLFVDGPGGDFNLSDLSPAVDAGGPLTTVAVADTGSGTSLILTSAYPFQPGWAGTTADHIAVGTVGNTATISSIDYATGVVTLTSGITRMDGNPVWLVTKSDGVDVLNGTAPDIGAKEHPDPGPSITSIVPDAGAQSAVVSVTITGSGFQGGNGAVAVSGAGVTPGSTVIVSDLSITSSFTIGAMAATGDRNVTVTTDLGVSNAVTFTVSGPTIPSLTSVSPSSGYVGATVNFALTGTNLNTGNAAVSVSGTGVTPTGVVVVGATSITGQFNIAANASATTRTVTVTTDTGTSNSVEFSVLGLGGGGRGRLLGRGGH